MMRQTATDSSTKTPETLVQIPANSRQVSLFEAVHAQQCLRGAPSPATTEPATTTQTPVLPTSCQGSDLHSKATLLKRTPHPTVPPQHQIQFVDNLSIDDRFLQAHVEATDLLFDAVHVQQRLHCVPHRNHQAHNRNNTLGKSTLMRQATTNSSTTTPERVAKLEL
jgi:hypothetical protein